MSNVAENRKIKKNSEKHRPDEKIVAAIFFVM